MGFLGREVAANAWGLIAALTRGEALLLLPLLVLLDDLRTQAPATNRNPRAGRAAAA